MTIEGEAGKRREQEVSQAASAWWKGLLKDLKRPCNKNKQIKELQVSSSNSVQGQTGVRGSLEFMLIVRRVTLASLVWLVKEYPGKEIDQIIECFVSTSKGGPFAGGAVKVFKNAHSIKTGQLQLGKGLLEEERTWLAEKMPHFSFGSGAT